MPLLEAVAFDASPVVEDAPEEKARHPGHPALICLVPRCELAEFRPRDACCGEGLGGDVQRLQPPAKGFDDIYKKKGVLIVRSKETVQMVIWFSGGDVCKAMQTAVSD